jgi:hypothetical protein
VLFVNVILFGFTDEVSEQSAAGKEVGPPKFLSQVKMESFNLFYVIFNLTLMINAFIYDVQAVLNSYKLC